MSKNFHTSEQPLKAARLQKFDGNWHIRTLKSGLRLVHVPSIDDNRFYIGATILAGARFEPPEAKGISHLLEHMMFRGSQRFPTFRELATAFEWFGGTWNAGTGHEHTEYWYSGSLQFAEEVMELFAEFILRPKFRDFKIEKKIIGREIDGELNEFGYSMDLDHHVSKLLWPQANLAQPIMGSKESLKKISLQEMRAFREAFYHPARMVICAVGGQNSQEYLDLLEEHFKGFVPPRKALQKLSDPVKVVKGPHVAMVKNADNEYQIQLSFHCEGEWSPRAVQYELITRILADGFCSRLGQRIREQLGMAYDIDTELTMFSDVGTVDICSSLELDRVEDFLRETCQILKELCEKGPTEHELERAKRRSSVELELMPDDPEIIGFKLSWSILSGKKTSLMDTIYRMRKVTVQDIQACCQKTFTARRAALVIMGPEDSALQTRCARILSEIL